MEIRVSDAKLAKTETNPITKKKKKKGFEPERT